MPSRPRDFHQQPSGPAGRRDLRGTPHGPGGDRQGGDGGRVSDLTPPPSEPPAQPRRPRLKKLRLAFVVLGLTVIASAAWTWGVMMAVSQDLPSLEAREQYKRAENSIVTDIDGEQVAMLTGNERRVLVSSGDISPVVKQAVVAVEDRRFYDHRGVDYMGILRAVREDILAGGAVQGGSTITQQFVKNALEAQQSRTILQKLRESSLAYHLEREWSKDKILTNYLNNIYFGEGAYGIEAAAQTYFGANHPDCGEPGNRCSSQLRPEEAAMLAGMISSPSAYSPRENPQAALERRNLVLRNMVEQGAITEEQYAEHEDIAPPAPSQIETPSEDSAAPYFTSWLRQQIVDRYGAGQAFGGGLRITATLDLDLQRASEQAIDDNLSGLGPTGAVVVIDNATGGVRALVGGSDFDKQPFNLATNGRRQPGSAFKPFTLLTALAAGYSPDQVYSSQPKEIPFKAKVEKKDGSFKTVDELFKVENYEDNYLGSASIATATTYSDNSVYAELGTEVGTDKVAETAEEMGIRSNVPENPAMILGGMKRGVTPLDMTYAYTTLARGGERVGGTTDSIPGKELGPVAIEKIEDKNGDLVGDDSGSSGKGEVESDRVLDRSVSDTAIDILGSVVSSGTGQRAAVGDGDAWGKTGTTDNNADAWFCGGAKGATACVWVGYPDGSTPMETEFGGRPVDGGTIPAAIWSDVMSTYLDLEAERKAEERAKKAGEEGVEEETVEPVVPEESVPVEPVPEEEVVPEESAPAPEPEPEPAPEQAPAPPAPPQQQPSPGGGAADGGAAPG